MLKEHSFYVKTILKNNKELINKMLDIGHSIGNHTASHLSMPSLASKENFSKLFRRNNFSRRYFLKKLLVEK